MTYKEWASDWRNHGEEEYLMGAALVRMPYRESEKSHHEHCTFCWARFSESMQGDERSGYMCRKNGESYWICTACYHDLKDFFHWQMEKGDFGSGVGAHMEPDRRISEETSEIRGK